MNALQRDLKKLVPLVESLGAEKAACRRGRCGPAAVCMGL